MSGAPRPPRARGVAACGAALALAGCVAPRAAAPPAAAPPPVVALPPPAAPVDWRDGPLTEGTWRHAATADGSTATFADARGEPLFVLRCVAAGGTVMVLRPGAAAMAGTATLTTSYGTTRYATGAVAGGVGWLLSARDPVLDRIAFSRGRFMIEGLGTRLVMPAWGEVARVIEDCRRPTAQGG